MSDEIKKALERLEKIYKKAEEKDDFKTMLQAQKEISKIEGHYADDDSPEERELNQESLIKLSEENDAIASHLLPLKLIDESYPLREHARVAAERVREGMSFEEE